MSAIRAVLLVLLSCSFLPAAELRTLKGEIFKGDLVSLSEREVVLTVDGKKVATPVDQVLVLNLADSIDKLPADTKYLEVELLDGSLLRCAKLEIKGDQVQLTLLQGQMVKLGLSRINWILNDAQLEVNRREWKEKVLSQKWARDVIAVRRQDAVNTLQGTLGNADDKGETIEFTLPGSDMKRAIKLGLPLGFYFQRGPDLTAKPVLCRLYDSTNSLIYAAQIEKKADGFSVTSTSGVTVDYPANKVVRLDYSKGKLTFLSTMTPASVKHSSTEGDKSIIRYRRDENFNGGEIRLGGTGYKNGLCLHATTELVYDLDGEYREFKALVGIDEIDEENNEYYGPTVLKILGDGTELIALEFSRRDKMPTKPVALNIKDVKKLTIIVTRAPGDFLDLRKHLALVDARVSK